MLMFLHDHLRVCNASTIIAVKCIDGIMIVADSLGTASPNSAMIANRMNRKIFLITPSTAVCCAAGDAQFKDLYSDLLSVVNGHEALYDDELDASAISYIARRLVNQKYRSCHLIIAGYKCVMQKHARIDDATYFAKGMSWEENDSSSYSNNNNELDGMNRDDNVRYVLCEITPSGSSIEHAASVAAGSGAALVSSVLSSTDQFNTVEQAAATIRQAMRSAASLDPLTGGDTFSVWTLQRREEY
jgi:20S proteasome alpha/beta subunit